MVRDEKAEQERRQAFDDDDVGGDVAAAPPQAPQHVAATANADPASSAPSPSSAAAPGDAAHGRAASPLLNPAAKSFQPAPGAHHLRTATTLPGSSSPLTVANTSAASSPRPTAGADGDSQMEDGEEKEASPEESHRGVDMEREEGEMDTS
jgi:hypothetical protein